MPDTENLDRVRPYPGLGWSDGGGFTHVETCPSRSTMYKLVTTYSPIPVLEWTDFSGEYKVVSTATQNGLVAVSPARLAVHVRRRVPVTHRPVRSRRSDERSHHSIRVRAPRYGRLQQVADSVETVLRL